MNLNRFDFADPANFFVRARHARDWDIPSATVARIARSYQDAGCLRSRIQKRLTPSTEHIV